MKVTLEEARVIFERCKIPDWEFQGNLLKESGQAVVVHVKRTSDGQDGVFRYLRSTDEIDVKRFQREVKILNDPLYKSKNIVNILAFSLDEPYWYISERGDDFRDYWEKVRSQNTETPDALLQHAIGIILKLLNGLAPLHEKNVVQRDIKPPNIILVKNEPVLIDFGLVYTEEEERITPKEDAVGNRNFSPDQMMFRNEDNPPWFDVFMLSQVLIWMVVEKSPKGWFRPLDWRFVKYPMNMNESYKTSLRALTSRCSDPYSGIQNANRMKELIENLFPMPSYSKHQSNPKITEIIEGMKKGRARSLVTSSTDIGKFEIAFPLFEKLLYEVSNHVKGLHEKLKSDLSVTLSPILDMAKWIEQIKKTTKFSKNEHIQLCNFRCGEHTGNGKGYFQINFHFIFFAPNGSNVSANFLFSGNPLPNNFLPFALRLNTPTQGMFYFAMDEIGSLYKFDDRFRRLPGGTNLNQLLSMIDEWVMNPKSWEATQ